MEYAMLANSPEHNELENDLFWSDLLGQTTHQNVDVSPNDSASQVGSHRSGHSNSSRNDPILLASLAEEQKRAELQAKTETLKKRQELELQKMRLKMEEQNLELLAEIAISDAKSKVLDKFREDSRGYSRPNSKVGATTSTPAMGLHNFQGKALSTIVANHDTPAMPAPIRHHSLHHIDREQVPQQQQCPPVMPVDSCPYVPLQQHCHYSSSPQNAAQSIAPKPILCSPSPVQRSTLDPLAPAFPANVTNSTRSTAITDQHILASLIDNMNASQQNQTRLAELIVQQQQRQLLPQSEIPKFGGNPIEYRQFIKAFESRVATRTMSDSERLHYLEQYCTGKAREVVKGYMHMDPSQGYRGAMSQLRMRFGDEYRIATAYVEKAVGWQQIKSDDAEGLEKFSVFLNTCLRAMEDIAYVREIEHPNNLAKIVDKLPYGMQERWSRKAEEIMQRQGGLVEFNTLVDFINYEARVACNPVFGKQARNSRAKESSGSAAAKNRHDKPRNERSKTGPQKRSNFATEIKDKPSQDAFAKPCLFCEGEHHTMDACRKLQGKLHKDKITFMKTKGLCFDCLQVGHRAGDSTCKGKLTCKKCNEMHPTVLHFERKANPEGKPREDGSKSSTEQPKHTSNRISSCGQGRQSMPIVPVLVKAKGGATVPTYAFLDSGSSGTFCSEELLQSLGITGRKTRCILTTMGAKDTEVESHVISSLEICDLEEENHINLRNVHSQAEIPATKSDIPTQEDVDQWDYLTAKGVAMKEIDAPIGLLIGNDSPVALEPWDVVKSQDNGPYAIRTIFGWTINGPLDGQKQGIKTREFTVNVTSIRETNTSLDEQLKNYFNHEFSERTVDDLPEKSKEDQRFLQFMESSITKVDGHYQMGLPLKDRDVKLPNNKTLVEQRTQNLKRKLERNPNFFQDYKNFMKTLIDEGHAEKVPVVSGDNNGRVWYIPHHGVYHPQKKKIRVVFDCAAKYFGTSLNQQLLQGPDLTNSLVGVLLRFRKEQVAFTADIKSMFHQVRVSPQDRDLLRFLWWTDGDLDSKPEEYRMTVHLFGATSSPSCANYALKKTAEDHASYSPNVISTIRKNFYVDDCLRSTTTSASAIQLLHDLISCCGEGGFRLTQVTSNRREVLESIPEEERAKGLKGLDLDLEKLPNERALGVQWDVEADKLGFTVTIKERPATRRGILSVASSLYDPLGFAAPYVLPAKILLQDLCRLKLDWDEEIPEECEERWRDWLRNMPKLADLHVERCIKPSNFGKVTDAQIHHFSDASTSGYGSAAYLRMENESGKVHCAFLLGKARVTPLKTITVPRLELSAATISARVDRMLKNELQLEVNESTFWTDSTAVIRYIHNETSRYQTFVANRLSTIHEASSPTQWRYVDTKLNPADDASRGLSPASAATNRRWIEGPDFLWKSKDEWPDELKTKEQLELKPGDPEVKKVNAISVVKAEATGMDKILAHFSRWERLQNALGRFLLLKKVLKTLAGERKKLEEKYKDDSKDGDEVRLKINEEMATRRKGMKCEPLTVDILQEAETSIFRYVQANDFAMEIKALRGEGTKNNRVTKKSTLYKLDPYIDPKDGLLRVGGRLRNSRLPSDSAHQILLLKTSPVSQLILDYIHRTVGHLGRGSVLSKLREKFWIPQCNSTVRKLVSKCVICRKYQAKAMEQKMADLPPQRLEAGNPPFQKSGVDYFGPVLVQRGRSVVKRYGVVFTCLNLRAVHLEVAHSLSTDSCINAIRRFKARRGAVTYLRSDNGTNFVGAERELWKAIEELDQKKIHESLRPQGIQWEFNPPGASHFGGVWERQIRTIRKVMHSILKEQPIHMDDEGLQTLFCEIENVINGRPITMVSEDLNDPKALTPNHLIMLQSGAQPPPGIFQKKDNFVVRRWRQVQYLADLFWSRWTKEYLPSLQERQKWINKQRNVEVNDIVLIVDGGPRNAWLLGRVESVVKDRRGCARSATIKTKTGTLERPVAKLVLVLEADE